MTPVHPEGPRYAAPIVFVPGLWMAPGAWRAMAGLLAHRGWQGWLAARDGGGGVVARAATLAAAAAALEQPPVLIAHDAGGLVALQAAAAVRAAAVVWVAPVLPGARSLRRLVSPWRVLRALVTGAPVERPPSWRVPPPAPEETEDAALVIDVIRGRVRPRRPRVPVLLVAASDDPRLPPAARDTLAAALAAETCVVPAAQADPLMASWQETGGRVHRWLVQRLGAAVLELYEEAMAERDAGDA